MNVDDMSCPECHCIGGHQSGCSLAPEWHKPGTAARITRLESALHEIVQAYAREMIGTPRTDYERGLRDAWKEAANMAALALSADDDEPPFDRRSRGSHDCYNDR